MPLKLNYHRPEPPSPRTFASGRSLMSAAITTAVVLGLNAILMYASNIDGFYLLFLAPLANVFIAAGCVAARTVVKSITGETAELHVLASLIAPAAATLIDWRIAWSMLPVC
jgi:hypothetical protein